MDIVSLLKLIITIALALIPVGMLVLIITSYQTDLTYVLNQMTDNGFILIVGLTMDRALENVYISAVIGTTITALATVGIFKINR